jgi:serine/threonine-protein kinase
MELLDGETLAARLRRQRRLPPRAALVIARHVAVALAAAHDRGVVHRDLKPDNIVLTPGADAGAERVKLLDFGIARLAADVDTDARCTQAGMILGTPVYMSPEQVQDPSTCDHRSDLYALGCVLFEMVAGQPPFSAPYCSEVLAAQMAQTPPGLDEMAPAISASLARLVAQLLAKTPAERPRDARAVVAAIDRAIDEHAAVPRGVGPRAVTRSPPGVRRRGRALRCQ